MQLEVRKQLLDIPRGAGQGMRERAAKMKAEIERLMKHIRGSGGKVPTSTGPSRMLGVVLFRDGTGCIVGVFQDGRTDHIDGTVAELTPLALEILAGKYAPERD